MDRRRMIAASASAAALLPALVKPFLGQQHSKYDPVLQTFLNEKLIVLGDVKRNNGRPVQETARRLASISRTFVAYGTSKKLDEELRSTLSGIVASKGKDRVIDTQVDDHTIHEVGQHGLDISDIVRQLPVVNRQVKAQILNEFLTGKTSLLQIESTMALGFEQIATVKIAAAENPGQLRPVQYPQPRCNPMDCSSWYSLATRLQQFASWYCAWYGIIDPDGCTLAWAGVASALAGFWGCQGYNSMCGGR